MRSATPRRASTRSSKRCSGSASTGTKASAWASLDRPYRQSERGQIYADVAQKLLDAGYAYESYSTPEEIEARNEAAGRPKAFGYDGYDRNLSEEQKAAFRAEGRKPALRIKMPDEDITFNDLIRGEITFKAGSVPDYVIVRPNGDPLYTLTNPVDDALMRINVVLRGEDLLSSTPRQIVLYRYLMELGIAKEMPLFGHLPYVMGQGNKKLSKRDPESNLFLHREHGFIKEGLLNYLALLGWSIAPDRRYLLNGRDGGEVRRARCEGESGALRH